MNDLPLAEFEKALDPYPHPFVFVTLSGAHLYGFPSADSDFDLRASHLLPGDAYWRLEEPRETDEPKIDSEDGLIELVTHDLRKFLRLLLKRNGYVLEQLTSPLVVRSSTVHRRMLELVPGVLTKNHYYHYRGFYHTEQKEYGRSQPRSAKKLLYCYRVLMTGCVLLREGVVEANLQLLNQRFEYAFLNELVEIKRAEELIGLTNPTPYERELERLEAEFDRAFVETRLPEQPSGRNELERILLDARANGIDADGSEAP